MILVGVIGEVGSGKSSVLASVAQMAHGRGIAVAGFVATAEGRQTSDKGADAYVLSHAATGERLTYATRGEKGYAFDEAAAETAWTWVQEADLLVLDEFGKREAAGEGWVARWPEVESLAVPVVILAVREGCEAEIQARLGRPFDLRVHPHEPGVAKRLLALSDGGRDWERVALFGGAGGAVETTLGSALHGGSVPLRGQVLSTLQAMLLTSAAEGLAQRSRVAWVGMISAGLKALSPAGSRVRPMIAISTQGLLFGSVLNLLGWNPLSVFVAGFLLGVWATIQGVVLSLFILGGSVIKAYDEAAKALSRWLGVGAPTLGVLMALICLLSGLATATACLLQWRLRHRGLPKWLNDRATPGTTPMEAPSWGRGVVMELGRPGFWLPVLIVVGILAAAGTSGKDLIPVVMRGVFISLLLVMLVRLIKPVQLVGWLQARGQYGPAVALSRVIGTTSARPPKSEP